MRLVRRARQLPFLTVSLAAAGLGVAALAMPASALAAPAGQISYAVPASRPAAANAVAGDVWSTDDVQPGSGEIDSYYAYDSANQGANAVTVKHLHTGVYQVDFAGLGRVAGRAIVQVSSYDAANDCSVSIWSSGRNSSEFQAIIDCFTIAGAAADTRFDLVVTQPTSAPHGIFDYAWVYKSSSSGRLTMYQYNSSRKENSVTHLSTGHYRVLLGGPASSGTHGVVKVTPYGSLAGDCQLASWSAAAHGGENVYVNCYDVHHHAQNRQFMVTYATTTSLLGINGQVVANAFANGRAALYQPVVQYSSKHGARITVVHLGTGDYEVIAVGSGGNYAQWGGDVQINSVGTKGQLCTADSWSTNLTPAIEVECFDHHDHLVDSPFTIEWVVP